MKKRDKSLTLEDFLCRTLTEEEVAKVDSIELEQRTYAETLNLEEMKLYKFTLQEEIRGVEGDYGSSNVVQVINGADGKEYSVWLPTVLYRKLQDCKAVKGSSVGVVFKGIPQGKRYKDFAVFTWTEETMQLLSPKDKDRFPKMKAQPGKKFNFSGEVKKREPGRRGQQRTPRPGPRSRRA